MASVAEASVCPIYDRDIALAKQMAKEI